MSAPEPASSAVFTADVDPGDIGGALRTRLQVMADLRASSRRDLWVWASHEELLLGMAGDPVVVEDLTLPAGIKPRAVKECFYNAFVTTLDHPHLAYAEGFAMSAPIPLPVNHAWCMDTNTGQVVDPTWVNFTKAGPTAYLGLTFSRAFMSQVLETGNDVPAVFESDWRRRGRTTRCGLVYGPDGLINGWGSPPPF